MDQEWLSDFWWLEVVNSETKRLLNWNQCWQWHSPWIGKMWKLALQIHKFNSVVFANQQIIICSWSDPLTNGQNMPDKLIPSSSSNTIGILPMRHMTREKRRTVNVTWLCCAVALILIVLIGFAFLLKNFFGGHWPNVPNPFLPSSSKGSLDQDIPPVSPFRPNVNLYDTAIPQENPPIDRQRSFEQEIITKPSTIEQRKRDQLFSENERVQVNIVRRAQWGAHAAKKKFFFESFAIDKAIVMETGGESCFNSVSCREMQLQWDKEKK